MSGLRQDRGPSCTEDVAVRVVDVSKEFRLRRQRIAEPRPVLRAVDQVNLEIPRGTTYGLVGESGSGKSTLARLITRLVDVTTGHIEIAGEDVTHYTGARLRGFRNQVQMVFQDPHSSFDPHASIADSLSEPLRTHTAMNAGARETRIHEVLDLVGLPARHAKRYPNELSGGQLQRVAVARALATEPSLIVLDEPVSALDVSTQAQVVNLLHDLQAELRLTYLFIAHDLSVVKHLADYVGVMYLGKIVEQGKADAIYSDPSHPYTRALLDAVPFPHPRVQRESRSLLLQGDVPSPIDPPSGCRFRTRCPLVMKICGEVEPPAVTAPSGILTHCHLH